MHFKAKADNYLFTELVIRLKAKNIMEIVAHYNLIMFKVKQERFREDITGFDIKEDNLVAFRVDTKEVAYWHCIHLDRQQVDFSQYKHLNALQLLPLLQALCISVYNILQSE